MSLGLFNCRLIQPAGDQLFFFVGCLAAPLPVRASSVQSPCDPSCSAPTNGRAQNASCLSFSESSCFGFRRGRSPVGCRRVHSHRFTREFPRRSPILPTDSAIEPNFNNVDYPYGGTMSGQQYNLPVSHNYPVISISDTVAWQRGKHQFKFGFTGSQEHDYYWNAPGAIPNYDLGLATGDPALNAFTNSGANPTLPGANSAQLAQAEQLYAVLRSEEHDINDNG